MRLLLDTHALVWWLQGDPDMSVDVRARILSDQNQVLVSPVSAWEMAIKHRAGKWDEAGAVLLRLVSLMTEFRFEELPISIAHAQAAGGLPGLHKDPFDRLLIAQAILENATIVSSDRVFAAYAVPVLWA